MIPLRSARRFREIHELAELTKCKLQAAADEPEHNLRVLCGHANLLDTLMEDLIALSPRQNAESAETVAGALTNLDDLGDDDFSADEGDELSIGGSSSSSSSSSRRSAIQLRPSAPSKPTLHPTLERTPAITAGDNAIAKREVIKYRPMLNVIVEELAELDDIHSSGSEDGSESEDNDDELLTPEDQDIDLGFVEPGAQGKKQQDGLGRSLAHPNPLLLPLDVMPMQFGYALERQVSWSALNG